jgi:hypothetical protein
VWGGSRKFTKLIFFPWRFRSEQRPPTYAFRTNQMVGYVGKRTSCTKRVYWVDEDIIGSLDSLFAAPIAIKSGRSGRIHRIDGLRVDLGFGTIPTHITHDSVNGISTDSSAFSYIQRNVRTLTIADQSTYCRWRDICWYIINRAGDHLDSHLLFTRSNDFNIDIGVTKYTAFYLNGKRVESYIDVLAMCASHLYTYHMLSGYPFVCTSAAIYKGIPEKPFITNRPTGLRFILENVIITRLKQ